MANDPTASLHAYERFMEGRGGADPNIPILVEAREEYGRLAHGITPPPKT